MPQKTIEINCKDDEQVHVYKRPKKYLDKPYLRMYQAETLLLAQDKELTARDWRIYQALLAHTDFDSKILVSQKTLSDELGIKQSHVSLTIKKLCQKEIIKQIGNIGSQKIYRLNPHIGFKCRAKHWGNLVATHENGSETPPDYTPSEVYQEEIPKFVLLEEMSQLMGKPVEEIDSFFKAWSILQTKNGSET